MFFAQGYSIVEKHQALKHWTKYCCFWKNVEHSSCYISL